MAKQKGRHWLRIGIYRSNIIGQTGFMSPIPNMQTCSLYPEKDEWCHLRRWIQKGNTTQKMDKMITTIYHFCNCPLHSV